MTSLKEAQRLVQNGKTTGWGQLVQLPENQRKEGLGFSTHKTRVTNSVEGTFCWNKMCLTIIPKSFDDNKVLKIDNWYC